MKDGTLRLEAVLPGVIRCVQTLNAEVAPPSELIVPQEERDFPVEVLPDGIVSGGLKAVYDAKRDRITWFEAATGELLLNEAGHELTAQPVIRYTTGGEAPVIERVKTVDGERNFIKNLKPVEDRVACRAKLRLDFAQGKASTAWARARTASGTTGVKTSTCTSTTCASPCRSSCRARATACWRTAGA